MRRCLAGLCVVFVSACGGGGSATDTTAIAVSAIQPDRLRYSQLSVFKLTGANLDRGVTVSVSKCKGLALVASGTAVEQSVSCTVLGTGDLIFETKDSTGTVLLSKTFTVPEPQVTLTTSMGTIVIELNPTVVSATVLNYLQYVNDSFYTNTLFHRVVASTAFSVVQGGWLTTVPAVQAGLRSAISLESNKGLSNLRGTVGMARSAAADSATSQFYFNVADNPGFDYVNASNPGYAVFGKVVQGLAVMDAMGALPTTTRYGVPDFPVTDVVLLSATQTQ